MPMPQADPQTMLFVPAGPGRAKRRPSGRISARWLMAVSTLVCLAGVGWQALGPGAGVKGRPIYHGGTNWPAFAKGGGPAHPSL